MSKHEEAELMRSLAECAITDEVFADHFEELSIHMADRGDVPMATMFRGHGRLHRVKAIAMRARLGAMIDEHGPLHLA